MEQALEYAPKLPPVRGRAAQDSLRDQPAQYRANHLIDRSEVWTWQADSAFKGVTTHRTDPSSAEAIRRYGVRIALTDAEAGWGQGFYSSTRPDPLYGTVSVDIAVRLLNPLGPLDALQADDVVDALCREFAVEDRRAAIETAGYDGLILRFSDGDIWVVAYQNHQVRVIRG